MYKQRMISVILGLTLPLTVQSAPSVAVDIAPLHSLVSQVMQGVAEPDLLIPAEASPHEYTLRPSQARALSNADIVFWMGESFTPWLEKAIVNVADSAVNVEVLAVTGTTTYSFREGATFEEHEHHDEDKHHDGHDEHDHQGIDPHAWLDPENAKVWINKIQVILSEQDPANAKHYRRNAQKAKMQLDKLLTSTQAEITKLGDLKFIVFHDAYQYFERRFNIIATGAISLSDAQDPSPARIKEVSESVKRLGVRCVFTEPQFNAGMVKNVFEGTSVSTIAVMDPIGVSIPIGKNHYSLLIQQMLSSLQQCK